jgi:hypothetical protein
MAGTPVVYTTAHIARGPVHIFTDVATPAAGAEVTIDVTAGYPSPDATANPSAVHWGLSLGGADLLIKPATEMSEADELTTPYRSSLVGEEAVISPKGILRVGQDFTLMNKALVGSTLSTPSGKKKITGGGLSTITYRTVLAIWAQPEDTTKYEYMLLYSAFNDNGLALTLSRKTDASSDMAWRGFAVSSRAAGDQLYQVVQST